MKSDASFPLENAGWPAFLVEAGGIIRRANAAAVNFFGPMMEGETVSLAAIWAEESETAERFLARWDRSATATLPLKFRGKGAVVTTFATYICTSKEVQKLFIFQLLREQPATVVSAPPAENKSQAVDSSVAHKQKLDCALQLARTVALDFNNALTSILGHASLVLSKMERDHPWRFSLAEVQKAAERAAEITSQLAAFSHSEKETRELAAGNLNAVLRRAVTSFQQARTSAIHWSLQLETKLYAAKFDEARMEQVFVKVIENSVEAVRDEGRISVASRNLEITEPTQDRTAQLQPGAYVCLEFTDDGKGMELDILHRAFDPFFTTKHGHRGLGLAFVYGIVTNHGGGVALSSQPGQGASLRLYLPASKRIIRENVLRPEDLCGQQTILMVDDEDLLLNTAEAILTSFGYRVLTANSGRRALEVLDACQSPVDLVITDLVMPQMSGRELSALLQGKYPGTPIVLTTGYVRPSGAGEEEKNLLSKPFTTHGLLSRVKEALESAKAS